jgi:hypothetical protein
MNAELEAIKKIVEEKWAIEAESNVFSDPEIHRDQWDKAFNCVECGEDYYKSLRELGTSLCFYCEWLVYEGPSGVKI